MYSLRVRSRIPAISVLLTGLCLIVTNSWTQERFPSVARTTFSATAIRWQPHVSYERVALKLGFPTGKVTQQEFAQGQLMVLDTVDAQGKPLPDGHYIYELVVTPVVEPSVKAALAQERDQEQRQALVEQLQEQGILSHPPLIQGGILPLPMGPSCRRAQSRNAWWAASAVPADKPGRTLYATPKNALSFSLRSHPAGLRLALV